MLLQLLGHMIEVAKRYNRKFAVFFVDLDRFKMINDTKGHDAGDQLLQEIATRYTQTLRAADVVSRQGGDEFVILIDDVHKVSDLGLVAKNILANTYKPVLLQGDECRVTARIIGTRKKIHIQVEKWASRAFLKGFVENRCQEELPQNPHWDIKTNSDHGIRFPYEDGRGAREQKQISRQARGVGV